LASDEKITNTDVIELAALLHDIKGVYFGLVIILQTSHCDDDCLNSVAICMCCFVVYCPADWKYSGKWCFAGFGFFFDFSKGVYLFLFCTHKLGSETAGVEAARSFLEQHKYPSSKARNEISLLFFF
jgi:hypothetical protein